IGNAPEPMVGGPHLRPLGEHKIVGGLVGMPVIREDADIASITVWPAEHAVRDIPVEIDRDRRVANVELNEGVDLAMVGHDNLVESPTLGIEECTGAAELCHTAAADTWAGRLVDGSLRLRRRGGGA